MSITPKTTILILAQAFLASTGCTFESNKCPEGFECTPRIDGTAGSGGSGGAAKSGAGNTPAAGSGGKANGTGGNEPAGGGDEGGAGGGNEPVGGSGNVTPGNPDGTWVHVTGNLAGTPSDCGTIPYVIAKPGEKRLIIGVVKRGVFSSTNEGKTWTQLGMGAGSAEFTTGLSDLLFDPEDSSIWWLAGVRFGGPYHSADDGDTFTKLADFPQNDGIAVDFSDPERKTVIVGGHEQVQEVQYSADSGKTWTNIGTTLPADSGHSSYPFLIDASTFLIGTGNSQVYRTTNKGGRWTKVVDSGGGGKPLRHSDGSLYWAARETGGLVRSMDDGATWKTVTPAGIVFGAQPIELPDGRIAMRGPMGMLVSDDEGANWRQVAPPVPQDYWWHVTTYDAEGKAFYTTRFACDTKVVNDDALMRYAWDYTKD